MHASFPVDFTTIQTQCREFNHTVLDEASSLFGLSLQFLDAEQEFEEVRAQIMKLFLSFFLFFNFFQWRLIKCFGICLGGFVVSSYNVYPYQRTTYFP